MMEAFIIMTFFTFIFMIPLIMFVFVTDEILGDMPPYPPNVVPTGCPDDDEEEEDDEEDGDE